MRTGFVDTWRFGRSAASWVAVAKVISTQQHSAAGSANTARHWKARVAEAIPGPNCRTHLVRSIYPLILSSRKGTWAASAVHRPHRQGQA